MPWILAIRETAVIKPSRLNIVAQGLSNSHPRSLPYPLNTLLSRVGSDHAASKRAGGVHYEKIERSRRIYTSHKTSGKPDGVTLHYIWPTRGLSTGTWRGHVPPHKGKEKDGTTRKRATTSLADIATSCKKGMETRMISVIDLEIIISGIQR